jgi:hypothetical protein
MKGSNITDDLKDSVVIQEVVIIVRVVFKDEIEGKLSG